MVDPRDFAPADIAGSYQRGAAFGAQRREVEERREKKQRLSDLLPRAAKGDQSAIDELYQVDFEWADKLDERQRKIASETVADLSNATRWADNPQKWEYVKQHYAQKGVDLSPYGFEDRERGLLALGQLGKYLEGAPKPEYRSVEAGGSLIDVSNGNPRVVIAPNPGGQETGAPVRQAGNVPQGAIEMLRSNPSLAPQFDEKYGPGAAQKILGGQTASPSGGFPY